MPEISVPAPEQTLIDPPSPRGDVLWICCSTSAQVAVSVILNRYSAQMPFLAVIGICVIPVLLLIAVIVRHERRRGRIRHNFLQHPISISLLILIFVPLFCYSTAVLLNKAKERPRQGTHTASPANIPVAQANPTRSVPPATPAISSAPKEPSKRSPVLKSQFTQREAAVSVSQSPISQSGNENQQTTVQAPITQSNSGGCNQQVVEGNNNTNNCNEPPRITASSQVQRQTGNPDAPWETIFTIQTSALTQTGDLRLKCSGPVLRAGISRFNPSYFSSGSNGPDPSDPTTAVYELGQDTLAPGKIVTVAVFSMNPVTVISGTFGPNVIEFGK